MHFTNDRPGRHYNAARQNSSQGDSFNGNRRGFNNFEGRDYFERPDMPSGNRMHFEGDRFGNTPYYNEQDPYSGNLNYYNPRNNPAWSEEPYMRQWTTEDRRREYPYHEEYTGEYYRGHGYRSREPEAYESYPGEYEMSRQANFNRNDIIENPRGRFGEEMYYWDHAENLGPGNGNRQRYRYDNQFRKYNMKGKRW